ncbi:hypothetical protein LGN09_20285 [Burkholderia cenocepacia]|nr:hypothetical protein [Burkholderia cenocepacia]MCA8407247.1 hypothetical protein [Burkholderia cenocepacia]
MPAFTGVPSCRLVHAVAHDDGDIPMPNFTDSAAPTRTAICSLKSAMNE